MLGGFSVWSRRVVVRGRDRARFLLPVLLALLSRGVYGQTTEPQSAPSGAAPATDAPQATDVPPKTDAPPKIDDAALTSNTPPPSAGEPEHFFPTFERSDFQGSLWTSYRYRSTYHDSDQDLYQSLLLNIGNPERDRTKGLAVHGQLRRHHGPIGQGWPGPNRCRILHWH